MNKAENGTDLNSDIVNALLKIKKAQMEAKLQRYEQFNFDAESILTHLASLSPKERTQFLKPWEEQTSTKKLGRPTKSNLELPALMDFYKKKIEQETGEKVSDRKALERLRPVRGVDKLTAERNGKEIKTTLNRLGAARAKEKAILKKLSR